MISRRNFMKNAGMVSLATSSASALISCSGPQAGAQKETIDQKTTQRLTEQQLTTWQELKYGMFICFGMSTYLGEELPEGHNPIDTYDPSKLDVDQWIRVAKDAGMKYAVLTAKHVAGHCLWPSAYTHHSVKHNKDDTDVVKEFIKACHHHDIKPGIYYCAWDNHHTFGSITPSNISREDYNKATLTPTDQNPLDGAPFTTHLYHNFMTAQIDELLDNYGPFVEFWIDIPSILGNGYRKFIYNHIAEKHPETVVVMNHGLKKTEGRLVFDPDKAWPTDVLTMERYSSETYNPLWHVMGKDIYLPAETCMTIGKQWFWEEGDEVKPMDELVEKMQACANSKVNLLLSVPPDPTGIIPKKWIKPLMELKNRVNM